VSLHEQDRDRVELVGRGGVELTRSTSQVSFFSGMERDSFHSSVDSSVVVGPFVRPLISTPGHRGPPYY